MPRSRSIRANFMFVALLAASLLTNRAVAQTQDSGGLWLMALAQGKFGDKDSGLDRWRWWLEGQARYRNRDDSLQEGESFDSAFVRVAAGYAITDRVFVHAGYAFFDSEPDNKPVVHENRVWQQLIWNVPTEGFTLQSRTRLEERFVEGDSDTGWRLREFLKTTIPLVEDKSTFVSVWDEMFWDLGDTDWGQRTGFRQNRAFAGIGQFLNEKQSMSIEVGYLNQWIDRPGEDRLNHILLLAFFVTF